MVVFGLFCCLVIFVAFAVSGLGLVDVVAACCV